MINDVKLRWNLGRVLTSLVFVLGLPGIAQADQTHIVIAGSTALLPLVKANVEIYARVHPEIRISVAGGGSGAGITQVAVGAIDIGDSDIPAPAHTALIDHRVAVVGFAIIANADVALRSLSRARLQAIFSGQITNWRDVGGPDEAITVVNRTRSSGTRSVFRRTIMGAAQIADSSLTVDASGTVVQTVASSPGAISYVALSAIRGTPVHIIAIDGVAPTRETITDGRYTLWTYEHMLTFGPPKPAVEAFISAVIHNDAMIEKLEYFPVRAMRVERTDR